MFEARLRYMLLYSYILGILALKYPCPCSTLYPSARAAGSWTNQPRLSSSSVGSLKLLFLKDYQGLRGTVKVNHGLFWPH